MIFIEQCIELLSKAETMKYLIDQSIYFRLFCDYCAFIKNFAFLVFNKSYLFKTKLLFMNAPLLYVTSCLYFDLSGTLRFI